MPDITDEVSKLRQDINKLDHRLQELERRLTLGAQAPLPTKDPGPSELLTAVASHEPKETLQFEKTSTTESSLETRIGLYWLNKIGIASLVVGIALFITYSFQYFGPAFKLATGFIAAAVLLALGENLERKAVITWYGRSLTGGGWALAYFTTYAMYYIPDVAVLASELVDICLLVAIAVCAMWHAIRRRSEVIAILAALLGLVTIPLGGFTYFTVFATALLALSLSITATAMRWYKLYFFGVTTSYLIFSCSLSRQLEDANLLGNEHTYLKLNYLLICWLVYNFALLGFKPTEPSERKYLIYATLINALAFLASIYPIIRQLFPSSEPFLLLGIAGFYGLSCLVIAKRQLSSLYTVHLLTSIVIATSAIPAFSFLASDWYLFLWAWEVPLLVIIGLRYEMLELRWLALLLALVVGLGTFIKYFSQHELLFLGLSFPISLIIGLASTIALCLAFICHHLAKYQDTQRPYERKVFRYFYFSIAGILAFLLPAFLENRPSVSSLVPSISASYSQKHLCWALESTAAAAVGLALKDRFVQASSVLGTAIVVLSFFIAPDFWTSISAAIVTALLYGLSSVHFLHFRKFSKEKDGFVSLLYHYYCYCGTVMLTILLGNKLPAPWVSAAWAVEGLVLLSTGFAVGDKCLRVSGLIVFGILVYKLLFVDLAGAETIQRVLSFIVAGVILLASSYSYAWFAKKLTAPTKE